MTWEFWWPNGIMNIFGVALILTLFFAITGNRGFSKNLAYFIKAWGLLIGIVVFISWLDPKDHYYIFGKEVKGVIDFFKSLFLISNLKTVSFQIKPFIVGVLIFVHWFWRHQKVNKPMDWNIDPEAQAEKRGPQKHWFGIWGNILFHTSLFVIFGPFSDFVWYMKVSFFYEVIAVLMMAYIVIISLNAKTKVKKSIVSGFTKWKANSLIVKVLSFVFVAIIFISPFFISNSDIPMVVLAFSVLPLTFVMGGTYEPHIRGRLVLIWFKKPMFNSFLLLGNKYIDSGGLHFTVLPSWFWGVKVFLVNFSTWEVEEIKTSEIPTRSGIKDSKVGQTIIVDSKMTVQCFDPIRYLAMNESDREDAKITEVVKRYALGALRDIARNITYDEAKLGNKFQYDVRRQDVEEMFKDLQRLIPRAGLIGDELTQAQEIYDEAKKEYDKISKEYNNHVKYLKLKIKVDANGEYVKHDEGGRFIPATFFEYLDWLLLTMTGCRLVEFDILDISGDEIVEDAEKQVRKSKLEMIIRKNLGEAEGMRRAAEIAQVTSLLTGGTNAQLGVKALTDLIGAEKAGLIFNLVKGLADKVNS